jgi:hypothetical protein
VLREGIEAVRSGSGTVEKRMDWKEVNTDHFGVHILPENRRIEKDLLQR